MYLNTIKPKKGSKQLSKRLGRGIGCGKGKTSGKGHKGQHARAGGYHKVGFEGGQSPLQRRLPKFGFTTEKSRHVAAIPLRALALFEEKTLINLVSLREAGLINASVKRVRIIATGEIKQALYFQGIKVTAGAKAAIEAVGGKIEE